MPATAFHLSVVPMSRSTGKSSVAKAAYITGGKLEDMTMQIEKELCALLAQVQKMKQDRDAADEDLELIL